MIVQPCVTRTTSSAGHLASSPGTWVFQPHSFQSISILLCANTSLIAPQCSYMYLFSFPTWRPIVCTPVPGSHPCPLLPHVDSHLSYRYPPVSILTSYLCL